MIIKIVFIGMVIIAVNLLIQAFGNLYWLKKMTTSAKVYGSISDKGILNKLLFSFLLFSFIHTIHAMVWAISYYIIPETSSQLNNFSEAVYFSLVTFTTLGYGDLSLTSDWRLLSGLEAINGIMLIGWSTAMMFSLIQNIYKKLNSKK